MNAHLSPRRASPHEELIRYGRLLLRATLSRMGIGIAAGLPCPIQRLDVAPGYERLRGALAAILQEAGWIEPTPTGFAGAAAAGAPTPDLAREEKRLRRRYPEMRPHLDLLNAAVTAYPEVLTGRQRAVEVLFPDGSPRLVEPIYRGDEISLHYNGRVAKLVGDYAAARLGADPAATLRILEIGAGTGGTSAGVIERLDAFAGRVEYVYSDLSDVFLEAARERFGADRPWISFRRLDAEQALSEQDLAAGSVDLILGANVLHAVRDIEATLHHLKTALRRNGLLIISEATALLEFSTLTFGLTEGWWRYTDPERRLPHGPLLSGDGWLSALARCGFTGGVAQTRPGDGWSLIAAESDGVIRQTRRADAEVQRAAPRPRAAATRDDALGWVSSVFSAVLKIPVEGLDPDAQIEMFGVDSLLVMKITRELETVVGRLPASLLFEQTTIAAIAGWMTEKRGDKLPDADLPQAHPPAEPPALPAPTVKSPAQRTTSDAIAIVGMAGRYPGAPTLDVLWQNLRAGRSAITEVPADRWDWRAAGARRGARWGAFLPDIDRFDPLFFRIAPREAEAIDPQERLFLETAWHALEDAAYTPTALRARLDGLVGVFAGVMNSGYEWLGAAAETRGVATSAHAAPWSIANRVSHVLDLNGPSLAVDTACSSSLTAIHLACESLRRGECRMALAGGVNLILHPGQLSRLDKVGMLSPSGRSSSFGAEADGMVDGEGVGVVVLRPLADAERDGDRILGVILGSAINAGGKAGGYTVPNPTAQAAVVGAALARAGVEPATVTYVEAHGTGTPLGDPIEVAGLTAAWGAADDVHCALGSIKSNIGHLESAAGVAGLTKVLLQFAHAELAPSLNSEALNPGILFEETPFTVQRTGAPWRPVREDAPLRAGLSSFGAGGANAHLVLEAYPQPSPAPDAEGPQTLALSARDPERLKAYAARLADYLQGPAGRALRLGDVAHTLKTGREVMDARLEFTASSIAEAALALRRYADTGETPAPSQAWPTPPTARPVSLPGYPFARERYWIAEAPADVTKGPFQAVFSSADPALRDHVLNGRSVLPAAAYPALVRAAARDGAAVLCDLAWRAPLTVGAGATPTVRVTFADDGVRRFEVASEETLHAQGVIVSRQPPAPPPLDLESARRRCPTTVAPAAFYDAAMAGGLAYGLGLKVLAALRLGDGEAIADLISPDPAMPLETALLDGALQAAAALAGRTGVVPSGLGELALHQPLESACVAHVVSRDGAGGAGVAFDISLATPDGRVLAELRDATFQVAAVPPAQRAPAPPAGLDRAGLLAFLRGLVSEATGVEPARLKADQPLDIYGLDSVLMLSVIERLEAVTGPQPKTLLFEHGTLDALTDHLAAHHGDALAAVAGRPAAPSMPAAPAAAPAAPRIARPETANAPIAIVGLAGRFPGPGADGASGEMMDSLGALEALWANLAGGVDAVTEIPPERWDWRIGGPGESRWGGFLAGGIDRFDALHFGISPREAELLDPQERLFMEVAWHALEHAGYSRRAMAGSAGGVFVGAMFGHYEMLASANGVPHSSFASIANRVSSLFDWHGPSLALDTMCSSSTTAIQLACEALRRGEIEVAVAGGVNLIMSPQKYALLAQGRFTSSDGRCRAFGAGGDGYVPGEGVGAVLLKRLDQALADNDTIWGVIRGGAVNHDGRSAGGFTAPNPNAQADLITRAMAAADVDPSSVGYVEAHGTGTALGDPIEVTGLRRAFEGVGRRIALGSIKSNIGHTESAAGIAALTKVLLQFRHEAIAPSLLHDPEGRLNPHIDFAATPFEVQRTLAPWPADGAPRRAGLSSFGAGGSNAHLVVEAVTPPPSGTEVTAQVIVPLSAPTEAQLKALAAQLAQRLPAGGLAMAQVLDAAAAVLSLPASEFDPAATLDDCGFDVVQRALLRARLDNAALPTQLRGDLRLADLAAEAPGLSLGDVAFTLQTGREAFDERLAIVASDLGELRNSLLAFGEGRLSANTFRGSVDETGEASRLSSAPSDPARAAALWAEGAEIAWTELAPAGRRPRRVPLPGCPFRRPRHWLRPPASTPTTDQAGHPLLGPLEATLAGHRFGLNLKGAPWLADHVVHGRAILPAAAGLELLRAAAHGLGATGDLAFSGVRWLRPLALDTAASLAILPGADGASFDLAGAASGRIETAAPTGRPALDIDALRARCVREISATTTYAAMEAAGLLYGPAFQTITRLQTRDGEALAELSLPPERTMDGLGLHPALLDGAFQAAAALVGRSDTAFIPAAAARVDIVGPLPSRCVAHLTLTTDQPDLKRLDIVIAGLDGRAIVQVQGLELRAAPQPAGRERQTPLWLTPVWSETAAAASPTMGPLLLVGAEQTVADAVTAAHGGPVIICPAEDAPARLTALAEGAAQVLLFAPERPLAILTQLAQAAMKRGAGQGLRLVYVFRDDAEDPAMPGHAAAAGFARSLVLEAPNHVVTTLGLAANHRAEETAAVALRELGQTAAQDVRIGADGRRMVRRLEEIPPPDLSPLALPPAPVCLITGGASGVGALTARHLARRHGARLVLSGRSQPGPAIEALLVELRGLGAADAVYWPADVSKAEDAATLVASIRERFGRLDGVVHSAGVTRDALLPAKKLADAEAVLAPKLPAAMNLDAAIGADDLAFFVLFSSTSGELGNLGQSDYAYANSGLGAFARQREAWRAAGRRKGVTRSIDWPLWRDGGMGVPPEVLARMTASLGLAPLETDAGLDAFDRALASGTPQLMLIAGDHARLRQVILGGRAAAPERAPAGDTGAIVKAALTEVLGLHPGEMRDKDTLESYGVASVAALDITNRLETHFGRLPATLLYEEPTLGRLITRLAKIRPATAAPTPAPILPMTAAPAPVLRRPDPTPIATDEAVAVIGMAGRYPLSPDIDQFWANLLAGRDCITDPPQRPGAAQIAGRRGGFIDDIDAFDPLFFRLSPRDAEIMDPQIRLFLETAWHALEDGGQTPDRLERLQADGGAEVGVFVASMHQHYPYLQGDTAAGIALSASAAWSIANRVSHAFDLRGPSFAVDSACSGSLTAIHLACEAVRRGDCAMAIAGGVNLNLHDGKYEALQASGMLGSTAESRSFGQGDGFLPGEGVGAVLLKPLNAALRDGDRIHGVIRASGVNHGGRGPGAYMVPSVDAQAALVSRVLSRAGVTADAISYVEAAANGSALGDPIEAAALTRAFRNTTGAEGYCALGAVKSNIGHLEAASGVSQLTKVLLQLRTRTLAASLNATPLNPALNLACSPFVIQHEQAPWPAPADSGLRLAGVCSVGGGGSNAFLLLEEAPQASPTPRSHGAGVFPLSARSEDQLREMAGRLRDWLASPASAEATVEDIAYTLQAGRAAFDHRLALFADTREDLAKALETFISGGVAEMASGVADPQMAAMFGEAECGALAADARRLATLWTKGAAPDWAALFWPAGGRLASLPGYPFARRRFWLGATEPAATPPAPAPGISIAAEVHAQAAALLKLDPAELDPSRDLLDYGFDSLLAIQLTNRLSERFGVALSVVDVFAEPTVAALSRRLEANVESSAPTAAIRPDDAEVAWPDDGAFPLTSGQRRIVEMAEAAPGHAAHNLPCGFRIRMPLDTALLAEAFRRTALRHEALRLHLVRDGADLLQAVNLAAEPVLRMSEAPEGLDDAGVAAHLMTLGRAPFDLWQGPLLRGDLVRLGEADHALLLTFHQFGFDGLSLNVFMSEMTELYTALAEGREPPALAPAPRFRDFVQWRHAHAAGPAGAADRAWWTARLSDQPPVLRAPTDHPRPGAPRYRGGLFTTHVSAQITGALSQRARREGVNLYGLTGSAFLTLLREWTGAAEILLGAPAAGRPSARFEAAIGAFANIAPLRLDLTTDAGELARQMQQRLLETLDHAALPCEDLAEAPPTPVLFAFQGLTASRSANTAEFMDGVAMPASRLVLETIPQVHQSGDVELALTVVETDGGCMVFFKYDADLFEPATIEQLGARYVHLLEGLANAPETAPLSFSQERLWFLHQLEPDSAAYSLPGALDLDGALDLEALRAALEAVIARHEPLRARFIDAAGAPSQVIDPAGPFELPVTDLSHLPPKVALKAARARMASEARRPFSLAEGPICRFSVTKLAENRHVLFFNIHHIVVDGWSFGVLLSELSAGYAQAVAGQAISLSPLTYRYADHVADQRAWVQTSARQQAEDFWRRQLEDAPTELRLPADHPRASAAGQADIIRPEVSEDLLAGLAALAQREKVTPFMIAVAACAALLHRWTGEDDLSLGCPVAGRQTPAAQGLIGFFANTIVLRSRLTDPREPFSDLLRRTRQTVLEALAHQSLPFERVVEAVNPERREGVNPLFQVMIAYENTPRATLRLGDAVATVLPLPKDAAQFDLTFDFIEHAGGLDLTVEYDSARFSTATMTALSDRLMRILKAVAADSSLPVADLPFLGDDERETLTGWSHGPEQAPPTPFLDRFAERVADAPSRPAILWGGETITYLALADQADRITAALLNSGAQPREPIGLFLERSADAVAAAIGIWKAGGVYVPLDPDAPPERLAFIIEDAGLRHVVSRAGLTDRLAAAGYSHGVLDLDQHLPATMGVRARRAPDDPAYMIYTSGSTGQPKGVLLSDANLAHLCGAITERYGLGEGDRVLHFAGLSFDVAIEEVFPTLWAGGLIVPTPASLGLEAASLASFVRRHELTVLNLPTAYWRVLAAQGAVTPETVRLVVVGGEATDGEALRRWREANPHAAWINAYGPTEATVTATAFSLEAGAPWSGGQPPIGRPLPGVRAYVLDTAGGLCAPGAPGELWLGGHGVALRYWRRDELTAARFKTDPFTDEAGARLYRTGDRAQWTAGGEIAFLGRVDDQVKLRGFRIELGEIEHVLAAHPQVTEAVVEHRVIEGEGQLVAFVTAAGPSDPGGLQAHLLDRLPAHMAPAAYVMLGAMPRTAGGKPDRAALRRLPVTVATATEVGEPASALERDLCALWTELLRQPDCGPLTDFFEAGGHSLLAVQMAHRISGLIGRPVSVGALLRHRTPRALAATLEEPASEESCLDALQPDGDRIPLVLAPGGDGQSVAFLGLAAALGPDQPLYAFRTPGLSGETTPCTRMEDLAARFSREIVAAGLRRIWIGGWSMGGVAALALAKALAESGVAVEGVIAIDSFLAADLPELGEILAERPEGTAIFPANEDALAAYAPAFRLDLPLHYIRAEQTPPELDRDAQLARWQALFDRPATHHVTPGDHFSLLKPDAVTQLAERITTILSGPRGPAHDDPTLVAEA